MPLNQKSSIVAQDIPKKAVVAHASKSGPTIYYDGSCSLCSAEISHYASREGGHRLGFIDVSAENGELGSDLSCDQAMRRFHVRRPDGSLVSGARAFVEVWDTLPSWRCAARVAKIPGMMSVLEQSYRIFLPIRPVISKVMGRFGSASTNTRESQK